MITNIHLLEKCMLIRIPHHIHTYVWGREESGAPIYRQCDYIIRYHVLDMYCAYCDIKSPNANSSKTVNTGSWEHDCPDGRK